MERKRGGRRPWLSLRTRVILVTIGLQVVLVVTFGGIQVYNEYRSMREFVRDSSVTFASCIAHSSGAALKAGGSGGLTQAMAMARAQHGEDVTYILMQDAQGRVLASTGAEVTGVALTDQVSRRALAAEGVVVQEPTASDPSAGLYAGSTYDVSVPILDSGTRLATLRMGVSARNIAARVWSVISRGTWMVGLALLAGVVLALAVDRQMRRSLTELIRVTRSIAGGDLGQRVAIRTGDELEELGHTFNEMTEQLAASRDQLQRWGEQQEEIVGQRTEELEEERQKLRGIVSGIGAAVLLVGRDLGVQWANDVAQRWFASDGTGVPLRPCDEAHARSTGRCQDCAAARAVATGRPEQCETIYETMSGQRRFFHVVASPIRDHHGDVMQVVELIQDVTEQRRMEQQLFQASKMVAVGELASGVAHEINNPLAVIGASVERMQRLIERGAAHDAQKLSGYLEAIQRHVYRCKQTIDKLLGFARRKDLCLQATDLNHVVQEAVGLVASRAAADGVRVVTSFGRDLPEIQTDAHGLAQVFVNLLSNALDACGDGGEIRIATRRLAHAVRAEVSDTGTGIAPEHITSIFEPFFTTKPEGKGTGLGLPICRRIISHVGGHLTVCSTLGAGATFHVTLPSSVAVDGEPA